MIRRDQGNGLREISRLLIHLKSNLYITLLGLGRLILDHKLCTLFRFVPHQYQPKESGITAHLGQLTRRRHYRPACGATRPGTLSVLTSHPEAFRKTLHYFWSWVGMTVEMYMITQLRHFIVEQTKKYMLALMAGGVEANGEGIQPPAARARACTENRNEREGQGRDSGTQDTTRRLQFSFLDGSLIENFRLKITGARVAARTCSSCVWCAGGSQKAKKVKTHNDADGGGWIAIAWRRGSVVGQTSREIQHQDPYHIHTDPVIPLFIYGPDYQQSAGKPCGPGFGRPRSQAIFASSSLFGRCSYGYSFTESQHSQMWVQSLRSVEMLGLGVVALSLLRPRVKNRGLKNLPLRIFAVRGLFAQQQLMRENTLLHWSKDTV